MVFLEIGLAIVFIGALGVSVVNISKEYKRQLKERKSQKDLTK